MIWLFASAAVAAVLLLGWARSDAVAEDWSSFEDYPNVACIEALVVDAGGNVMFDRNASVPMPMASITKIMTALVAIESGVPLDSVATVSKTAAEITGSVAGYREGEQVTLRDLLKALLVHSGNDSAIVIAELVGGSLEGFVGMMNQKAVELGLTNTHFANPHGLDEEGHYSTAYDLVQIAKRAWQYQLFRDIVGSTSVTLPVGGVSTTMYSTDELLNVYPGMRGVKTGFTYGAGNAFLGCAQRGGTFVYTVVLGTESSDARFVATSGLLDWAYGHFPVRGLADADDALFGYHSSPDRFGWSYASTVGVDASYRLSPYESSAVTMALVHPVDSSSAIASAPLGTVNWYLNGKLVASRTVVNASAPVRTQTFGPVMSNLFY